MTETACNGSEPASSSTRVQRYRADLGTREFCGIPVTPTQLRVLRFVAAEVTRVGWAPSVREISRHLGASSTNCSSGHLDKLEDKGLIRRGVYVSRGLRITDLGAKVLEEAGR